MADQEQLDILKQGVHVWNQWRREHPDIRPNLRSVNLSDTDLRSVNLSGAEFQFGYLRFANLGFANLSEANLNCADLNEANLNRANLRGADLSSADLRDADLRGADLGFANLGFANLGFANLSEANLNCTQLHNARVRATIFGNVDLSMAEGLETVQHDGPSIISIDTIYRSKGKIPEVFLKGAGVQESFLTNMRALVESMSPIDFYSCFISYSSKDHGFAERLYADFQSKGVRCWFAPEDMKIGDKLRPRIDESIRVYDKLLLVLSEHSVSSQWVEQEVETALAREREQESLVLFPIRLDEAVFQLRAGWPSLIKNTRHIGDFRSWKQHDEYQKAFTRLLRDLKAETER